jgi:bacterioferritin
MRGNEKVIEQLNGALSAELTAIVQYMVQAEMCDNWGYLRLGELTKKRAIEEMRHAEKLIERMLFLDTVPDVQSMPKLLIGIDVEKQMANDLKAEREAIVSYNRGIEICRKAEDNASADLLKANLHDEERHAEFLETQLSLMKEMGLQNYLAQYMTE